MEPIQLDPNILAAKTAARWRLLIGQLVEENAQLETYVAQLTAQLAEAKPPDSWGDSDNT
jgi:hypothetical protein